MSTLPDSSTTIVDQKMPLLLESGVAPDVVRAVIQIAVDLAKNGREGKRIGTMFVVGDEDEVMRRSHPLILDPLQGHPEPVKNILSPNVAGTIRELALLDGAFVVSSRGIVISAARCLDVSTAGAQVPLGLGSRHQAAASVTLATKSLAVVVSQSSKVRIFYEGRIVVEIVVELMADADLSTESAVVGGKWKRAPAVEPDGSRQQPLPQRRRTPGRTPTPSRRRVSRRRAPGPGSRLRRRRRVVRLPPKANRHRRRVPVVT